MNGFIHLQSTWWRVPRCQMPNSVNDSRCESCGKVFPRVSGRETPINNNMDGATGGGEDVLKSKWTEPQCEERLGSPLGGETCD